MPNAKIINRTNNRKNVNMFISDLPITSKKQDKLGRVSFTEQVARAILQYKNKESVVLGLYGAWGSGKTSIINMIVESLKDSDSQDRQVICRFNPWNYSDQNQLISQFFKQLSLSLGKKDKSEELKNASKRLDLYAKLIEPLQYVPPATLPVVILKKICEWFSALYRERGLKTLGELKSELNNLLEKQNQKIVVIIDDIDRLNNTEIRQIFQLVKSLCDFKNTIYLLAFDMDVVCKALSKVQEGNGYDYLAKVVQIPFNVPSASKFEIHRLLCDSIDEIIKDYPQDQFDQRYWQNIFHSGLKQFFDSIRGVNRFINIFRFKYFLLKEEVNIIDLIGISVIEVFLPDMYLKIRDNKNLFVQTQIEDSHRVDQGETLKKEIDAMIEENAQSHLVGKTKSLLTELFPKLKSVYSGPLFGASYSSQWRKEGRICSEDNFDIFFQLSIPAGRVSKSEIEKIISKSKDYEKVYEAFKLLNEQGRISEALERLLDYSSEFSTDKIQNIITALMDQGDRYPKDAKIMLGFDNISRISRIGYFFTKDLHDKDKCYEIFKNAISATENSIHTIIYAIIFLGWEHGKGTKEGPKPDEERRVSEKQLEELEKLACNKIDKWAKEGRLIKHQDLVKVLYVWENWAGKEIVAGYVKNSIEADEGLIDFITKFPSEVRSRGMDDYGYRTEYRINLKNVEHFVKLDDIVPRVRNVKKSDKFNTLQETEQKAIELFLDTVDGKIKDL